MKKKFFLFIFFLLALLWFVLWVWSLAFGQRPWLSPLGSLFMIATGFCFGLVFFSVFRSWFMAMHAFANVGKRMLGILGCCMALLFFGDLFVQAVLWFSTLLGNRYGMSFWIFLGFFAGAVVVYFDRRFFGPIEEAANKVLAFFEPKD